MHILYSSKSNNFYYGYTTDLQNRFNLHNKGKVIATKPYKPWKLVWYGAFENSKLARDFELYLKSGSGKAFAYKRLVNSVVLKKDSSGGK